jgi:chemotaxis protein CheC
MPSSADNRLESLFRTAAEEASASLSKWLGRPTRITVKEVAAIPLDEAVVMLGSGDAIQCVCAMHIQGDVPGILALAASDASGLALADLLLGRPAGTSTEWGEIERSAAAETTNIIGCAYLNAMAADAGPGAAAPVLMPSPPWFVRDYPEAVMGSIVMTQETVSDGIFLTRTVFDIEGTTIRCSLVFVPQVAAADDGAAARGTSA